MEALSLADIACLDGAHLQVVALLDEESEGPFHEVGVLLWLSEAKCRTS